MADEDEIRTFKVPVEKKQHLTGFVVVDAADEEGATAMVEHQIDSGVIPDVNWAKEAQDDDSGIQLVDDPEEVFFKYTNKYKHCGEEWEDDKCDSMHNDKCPKCNKEIEPYESVENATGDVVDHIGSAETSAKRDQLIIELAQKQSDNEGTLEIDDGAKVSEAEKDGDNGAYVEAWVWVPFSGTKLSKEGHVTDDPEMRIAAEDHTCKKCGDNIFKGHEGFAVPEVGDKLDWYCKDCIPDEFKPEKPKKKARKK